VFSLDAPSFPLLQINYKTSPHVNLFPSHFVKCLTFVFSALERPAKGSGRWYQGQVRSRLTNTSISSIIWSLSYVVSWNRSMVLREAALRERAASRLIGSQQEALPGSKWLTRDLLCPNRPKACLQTGKVAQAVSRGAQSGNQSASRQLLIK
jgi:hypothetical protein